MPSPVMLLKSFTERIAGRWISQRRNFYPQTSFIENLFSDVTVQFEDDHGEKFRSLVSWRTSAVDTGEVVSEGEVLTEVRDGKLFRNIDYLSEDPTICEVKTIDADCIVLTFSQNNMNFREETRLMREDILLTQTLGMRGVEVFMVGQYYETKVQN